MSINDTPAHDPLPSLAWSALLRAELARIGVPAEAATAALVELGVADRGAVPQRAQPAAPLQRPGEPPGWAQPAAPLCGSGDSPSRAQQAAPLRDSTQHSALSTQHFLRWGGRTLALGARTLIMGVVNVTDDSLSGDGLRRDLGAVLARAEALVAAGADILDVGGESTRPGAADVPATEERARVEPAVAVIARHLAVPISVDTRKAVVAEAALAAGAGAVNDVSGLRYGRALAALAARAGAALILGHWAPPRTARQGGTTPAPPRIGGRGGAATSAVAIVRELQESVGWALAAGCAPDQLAVDPGLGFGKAPRVSLALLRDLSALRALGLPLVVGPSRKGFIGRVLGPAEQHGWEGTAAAVALAIAGGAAIVRVHDVARLARVARMSDAIVRAAGGGAAR
jgi:dihydropteroate synthase